LAFRPARQNGGKRWKLGNGRMTDLTKRREKKYPEEEFKQIMSL
jgi:hypothetical protein